jgi:hypothetical protein
MSNHSLPHVDSTLTVVLLRRLHPCSNELSPCLLSRDTAWHGHSTDTGFFEEAQYRYTANASNPSCIQATIFWQHGTYGLNDNGSITLYPFSSDGRIQVQDPCAATTNIITYYNQQVRFALDNLNLARSSPTIRFFLAPHRVIMVPPFERH